MTSVVTTQVFDIPAIVVVKPDGTLVVLSDLEVAAVKSQPAPDPR